MIYVIIGAIIGILAPIFVIIAKIHNDNQIADWADDEFKYTIILEGIDALCGRGDDLETSLNFFRFVAVLAMVIIISFVAIGVSGLVGAFVGVPMLIIIALASPFYLLFKRKLKNKNSNE